MRRAHMYITVLLVVWAPCLVINVLGVFGDYANGSFGQSILFPLCVFLQTGQGVFNTCIYIFGTKSVTRQLLGRGVQRSNNPLSRQADDVGLTAPLLDDPDLDEKLVRFDHNPEEHSEPPKQWPDGRE